MMSSVVLKVDGVTLVSDEGTLVDHLTFQVSAGEIVALTGKSGSGKTSIALAILNLLPSGIRLTEGTIRFTGDSFPERTLTNDSKEWNQLRGTHIGYTQQDAFGAFDPVMTLGTQMMLIISERTTRRDSTLENELRSKMEEVGLVEIDRLLSSYPHQLSGGQLQRCQIAMAVVIRPQLLIADEPTAAIDKINQLELLDVFAMLRQKYNMAILCITHEDAVVRYLADKEIRIGKISQELPLSPPSEKSSFQGAESKILEVNGLEYNHSYGGMIHKEGASIGKIDFELHRGMCIGIVGESGSGKSTLAQLLVGLLVPMHGKVLIDGIQVDFRNVNDIQRLRTKVQLVMQDGRGSLHPYLNIGQILSEINEIGNQSKQVNSIDIVTCLGDVGLPESIMGRTAEQLSGGECLRVSIARAMLMQPEILICDESTSALDGPTRDGIIELLRHLMNDRGLAIIFISHDEQIIRGLADHVMVLADGKVVEQGPAYQVIRYPAHPASKKIFNSHATLEQRGRL